MLPTLRRRRRAAGPAPEPLDVALAMLRTAHDDIAALDKRASLQSATIRDLRKQLAGRPAAEEETLTGLDKAAVLAARAAFDLDELASTLRADGRFPKATATVAIDAAAYLALCDVVVDYQGRAQ